MEQSGLLLNEVLKHRQIADSHFEEGNYIGAFKSYLICLQLCPDLKPLLKEKLIESLQSCGDLLEKQGKIDELWEYYRQALLIFDDFFEITYYLGNHLYRLNFNLDAYRCFSHALRLNNCVPAFRSLQNASRRILQRRHYCTLNDSYRNGVYREAIVNKLLQNFRDVLNVGIGSVLLSEHAARYINVPVYVCDYNKQMISIVNNAINGSELNNQITLIDKTPSDLKIPDDIPSRLSLIAIETIDCDRLNDVLRTLYHAWNNLLLPALPSISDTNFTRCHNNAPPPFVQIDRSACDNRAVVLPFAASLYVAGVECFSFGRRYYYPYCDASRGLDWLCGLENISLDGNYRDGFKCPPMYESFTKIDKYYCAKPDETYRDSRRLRQPHFRLLSEPTEVFGINFNDVRDVERNLFADNNSVISTVDPKTDGYLHAIVAWFKVIVDENVVTNSFPFASDVNDSRYSDCRELTMFPLHRLVRVRSGQALLTRISWYDGNVSVNILDDYYYRPYHASPQNVVATLNDTNLTLHCDRVAGCWLAAVTANARENPARSTVAVETLLILDLFWLPVFGLNFLRMCYLPGSQWSERSVVRLICVDKSEECESFVRGYLYTINVPQECVEFVSKEAFHELCKQQCSMFDIVVADLVKMDGDLNEDVSSHSIILRGLLKEGGIFYPEHVNICCQLIESKCLRNSSSINDSVNDNFRIGSVLNQFKVSHHLELDLTTIDYKPISEVFQWVGLSTEQLREPLEREQPVRINANGYLTAVIYWFDLNYRNLSYRTLNDTSCIYQAAFVTDNDIPVSIGKSAIVGLRYCKGLLRITLDDIR